MMHDYAILSPVMAVVTIDSVSDFSRLIGAFDKSAAV